MRPSFTGAKPEPLGLMACKVILWSHLSSSTKTVGGILIDHVNWKAGQDYRCDPGIDRLVELSGFARSTVQEGLRQLQAAGLIIIHVHGGRLQKNFYEFRWDVIRARDAETLEALKSGCHPPWITDGTSPESRAQTRVRNTKAEPERHAVKAIGQQRFKTVSRRDARRQAAARRWEEDLRNRHPDAYIAMIPSIDDALQEAATEAEMAQRGSGAEHIIKALSRRFLDRVRSGT